MFKKMPVCRLMISCPSDVKTEIEIINRVVDNINDSIGFSMNIFVKTLYWSKNVMPEAGEYPQSIINKQILDKSDAIIAIFGNRIGSPTQHYESGTIEEIELMIQKGKQVLASEGGSVSESFTLDYSVSTACDSYEIDESVRQALAFTYGAGGAYIESRNLSSPIDNDWYVITVPSSRIYDKLKISASSISASETIFHLAYTMYHPF